MIDRVHRELTDEDIRKIADTYHAWRGDQSCMVTYEMYPVFAKALLPTRFVNMDIFSRPGAMWV